MKRLFLILAVVAATTVSSLSAQNQNAPAPRERGERVEREDRKEMIQRHETDMAEKIGLNESQSKEFSELNSSYISERNILMEAIQRSVQDLEQKKMKSIVELLDDDQMANYLVMITRHNPRGAGARMQGAPKSGAEMPQRAVQPKDGAREDGEMRGERPERGQGQRPEGVQGQRPERGSQDSQRGERPERGEMGDQREANIAKMLGITEDQAKQLTQINSTYQDERKELNEGMRKAIEELEQKRTSSIVNLLDDSQMAKYISMACGRAPQGGRAQMRGEGNRPMPMAQRGEGAPEQGGKEGGRPRDGRARPDQPRGAAE